VKKIFGIVAQAVGFAGTALVIVKVIKNYTKIELDGLPSQIYATYVTVRNNVFDSIGQVLFDWWISISFPDLVKDIISLYLLFGLSLVRSEDMIPPIYKYILRAGSLKYGESKESKVKLFFIALRRVFVWPIEFIRYVLGWKNFPKNNQPGSSVADEQKRALARMQYNIGLAGVLSYPFALAIALIGAILFFLWNYLERI